MKFFLGLLIGLFLAIGIAAGGAYLAFGDITDFGDRDKSADITQSYDLADFDGIDIAGVYELDVTVGPDFSVVLTGSPEEMGRVEARVENGDLVLDQRRPTRGERRWRHQGVTAAVTLPALSKIDVSGIIDGDLSGIDAEEFNADFSGVGSIELSGSCGHLRANVSGIGEFDARELKCKTADVSVSGIGDASVYASDGIDITVSGIGSVNIYGSPSRVDKNSSVFSNISVK
jgi:putative autotransporter adhesin-like protein